MSKKNDGAPAAQLVQHIVEEPARAFVQSENLFEIEDEVADALHVGDDVVHHAFRAGEVQVALQLIDLNAPAFLVQGTAFLRGANAVGGEFSPGELQADGGLPGAGAVQQMEIAMARNRIAHANAPHAVAPGVERRRKDRDAKLAGQHGDDAAGDTALGRHADGVEPFACIVIHAARAHDAEHALDVFATDGLLAGDRIHPAIGERGRHDAEIISGDGDGALLEIQLDRGNGIGG